MGTPQPVPLDIPPGVVKSLSSLAAKGRWAAADKVRFVAGKAEKIGGWILYATTQLDGLARGAFAWTTSANISLLSMGTWRKLYSIDADLVDITPLRESGTLGNNPFTTVNLSTTVTVADTTHGLSVDAIVHFTGATAVGGITITGAYAVASVVDADHYTIVHTVAAAAGATGGGAAVAYEYEINPGQTDTVYGLGFGAGGYGEESYGDARSDSTLALPMRFWAIGRYGNDLIASYTGGPIYLWDEPASASRATLLANSPTCNYSFVTAERFIFALGTTTGMTVDWPDIDDPTDWTPVEANTANTRILQDGNSLMAGCVFNDAVNLIWSDTAFFVAQYLPGSDEIYDIAVAKTNAGLVASAAFCVTPLGVFWLSGSDLYLYNGAVDTAPNFQDVRGWFFRMFRRDKAHKAAMSYNAKKNEVQLHYTSTDASENDSYLLLALDTLSWAPGTMAGDWGHTAMAVRRNPTKSVYAAHADGYVYEHENGTDADGAALPAYIENSLLGLSNGYVDLDIIGYQPDFERQIGDIVLKVSLYDRPRKEQLDDPVDEQTFTIGETDDLVDMLMGGRYAKFRLTSNEVGGDFRLGVGQFEIGGAGSSR
jgi:hypothetical protein